MANDEKHKLKVTQLTVEEVKKKIYDDDIENIYILSWSDLKVYALSYYQLRGIMKHMLDGSAFLKLEEVSNYDRANE